MSGYCEMCGETVCVCADDPVIDWQSTCETWKRAHDKVDKIACELQDACHKQAHRMAQLEYLISKTYWIDDNNQLHQALMDNLLADVAREVLDKATSKSLVDSDKHQQFVEMEETIAARDEEIKELKAVIRRNEMI